MRKQLSFWLNRPEYLYQPAKLLRRILRSLLATKADSHGLKTVWLPWGLPVEVDCSDVIGRSIAHVGIFDLPVIESIFRLVDSSDVFVDVGANLGCMTSAGAAAGARRVISFEPHPLLFARLVKNVRLWREISPEVAERVEVLHKAVSSVSGMAALHILSEYFPGNHGIATLERGASELNGVETIDVSTTTLDEIVARVGPIGLLKIDIEGHELKAFSGCRDSLAAGKIRDIVYEDFGGLGSKTSQLLWSLGYTTFGVHKTLAGPVLLESAEAARLSGATNLIATIESARLRKRMTERGYKCLNHVQPRTQSCKSA